MRKSRVPQKNFRSGSLRNPHYRHTFLTAMAKDAEKLEAQGRRLAELRALARVSQETAAHQIGVSVRAYREWELGRGGFNDENIKAAAKYFGTTPDYIEYGVMKRERGPAPEPFPISRLEERLAALEEAIRLLRAELAAHDAAELSRTEAILDAIHPTQRRRPA